MKSINWTATTPWETALRQTEQGQEEVLVVKNGHAVALVIPFDDEDLEWYAREREPDFLASLVRARQQVERGETIRHEDLKRELGLDEGN
jgi:antitoxin (DNA-binding transcriptional repressor) of toxin-antitoxin stability system